MRIVRTRCEGKAVFYALDDDHIRTALNSGLQHIGEPIGIIEALS